MKGFDLENLQKYSKRISDLDVKVESCDDGIWKINFGDESEIAVLKSLHPTKLLALTEAERSVEAMIQGKLQEQFFKEKYGIK